MKEEINKLIDLQAIDLKLKKLNEEMSEGFAELEKRKTIIEERQQNIAQFQEKLEILTRRKQELELEIEEMAARIKDRQTKLMNVQTNREYQSLLKEIEDAKKKTRDGEEEILHLIEQIENLETKTSEEGTVCKAEEGLLAEKTNEVEKHEAGLQKQKDKIIKQRNKKAKGIPEALQRKYDTILAHRNGIAIVGVTDGVCQGCFMSIPPQQYNNLLKGDDLFICPTCQRMTYYLPAAEDE